MDYTKTNTDTIIDFESAFEKQLSDLISDEITTQIDIEILHRMMKFMSTTNESTESQDVFLYELGLVKALLPLIQRAEQLFLKKENEVVVKSDDGQYEIRLRNNRFSFDFLYRTQEMKDNNREPSRFVVVDMDYENVNRQNNMNEDQFSYNPFDHKFKINSCEDYFLNENFEHDEALYFQKLTQVDLPPEEHFVAIAEVIRNLWEDAQYTQMHIEMQNCIGYSHVNEYEKLLQVLEGNA